MDSWPWTHNHEVPSSNPRHMAAVPVGKAIYYHDPPPPPRMQYVFRERIWSGQNISSLPENKRQRKTVINRALWTWFMTQWPSWKCSVFSPKKLRGYAVNKTATPPPLKKKKIIWTKDCENGSWHDDPAFTPVGNFLHFQYFSFMGKLCEQNS